MKYVVSVCVLALGVTTALPTAHAEQSIFVDDFSFEGTTSALLQGFAFDPFLPQLIVDLSGTNPPTPTGSLWFETGPISTEQNITGQNEVGLFRNNEGKPGGHPAVTFSDPPDPQVIEPLTQAAFIRNTFDAQLPVSLYQQTGAVFRTGKKYTLTVAIGESANSPLAVPDGGALELVLGFFQPNGGAFVDVASTPVDGTMLDDTQFQDFSLDDVMVTADDEAFNQSIVVLFRPRDGQAGVDDGGIFELDNVRLNAVPEPTTMALLSLGALAAVRRRR